MPKPTGWRPNLEKIQTAQGLDEFVYLHYIIETGTVYSTYPESGISIGYVPYVKNIVNVQVYIEGEYSKP
jgi:hypothetical protein